MTLPDPHDIRALLNWGQSDLGFDPQLQNSFLAAENGLACKRILAYLLDALQSGVELIPGEEIKIKQQPVAVFRDSSGYWQLLEDIYRTSVKQESDICMLGRDQNFVNALAEQPDSGERLCRHINRLQARGLSCRLVVREGEKYVVAPLSWYRQIPERYLIPSPLYIYGNRIATVHWSPDFKSTIYENAGIARTLRKIFDFIWARAEPLQISG